MGFNKTRRLNVCDDKQLKLNDDDDDDDDDDDVRVPD